MLTEIYSYQVNVYSITSNPGDGLPLHFTKHLTKLSPHRSASEFLCCKNLKTKPVHKYQRKMSPCSLNFSVLCAIAVALH